MPKRACDSCYRRKISCESGAPGDPCEWCAEQGFECTFKRVSGRQPSRTSGIEYISLFVHPQPLQNAAAAGTDAPSQGQTTQSLPTYSDLFNSYNLNSVSKGAPDDLIYDQVSAHHRRPLPPSPSSYKPRSFSVVNSAPFSQLFCQGAHLGYFSPQNGIPVFSEAGESWLSSKTGLSVSFQKFSTRCRDEKEYCPMPSHRPLEHPVMMPDEYHINKALEMYNNSSFRLAFPVVDRVLFPMIAALAYGSDHDTLSTSCITAKACVMAFLSIAPVFHGRPQGSTLRDKEWLMIKSRSLLSTVWHDLTVITLQTTFMIFLHQTFTGNLQAASLSHAEACRMIFVLGGHLSQESPPLNTNSSLEDREYHQLRMIFWLSYMFDKDISFRTGQPPLMSEIHCDLTLPTDYADCYLFLPDLQEDLSSQPIPNESFIVHLPGDPRLSCLKDKAFRLLFSTQAVKKSRAEVLHDIRVLDEELESWRQSLPQTFRPALSLSNFPEPVAYDAKLAQRMRHICLHLEYHHLITTIHRASGRCLVRQLDGVSEYHESLVDVLSSSALLVEASRSTLLYFKAAVQGLASEAFWMYVFYPMVATVTIFLNILVSPLDEQTHFDLTLLHSASEIIREMPVHQMTEREAKHIELVEEVIAEFIRLATHAIKRASMKEV